MARRTSTQRPKGARGSSLLRVLSRSEAAQPDAELRPTPTRNPCPGLWKTPVIRWDGELMACCADVDNEIHIGNLRDAEFDELWFGERMTELRLLHIEGRFEEIPKCWSCGGINFYKLSADEVRVYLDEARRPDLWTAYASRMGLDST